MRIDPGPPAVVGGGFSTGSLVYDVTAYWSLTGVPVHSFASPLEIVLSNPTGDPTFVPVTFENGAWQPIPLVPTAGTPPARLERRVLLRHGRDPRPDACT